MFLQIKMSNSFKAVKEYYYQRGYREIDGTKDSLPSMSEADPVISCKIVGIVRARSGKVEDGAGPGTVYLEFDHLLKHTSMYLPK